MTQMRQQKRGDRDDPRASQALGMNLGAALGWQFRVSGFNVACLSTWLEKERTYQWIKDFVLRHILLFHVHADDTEKHCKSFPFYTNNRDTKFTVIIPSSSSVWHQSCLAQRLLPQQLVKFCVHATLKWHGTFDVFHQLSSNGIKWNFSQACFMMKQMKSVDLDPTHICCLPPSTYCIIKTQQKGKLYFSDNI